MPESNQVTVYHPNNRPAIYDALTSVDAIERIGHALGKSGMFGVDNQSAGVVILLTCALEGITPLDYCRTYDTVLGKPRKKAMAAYAEFRKLGGRVKWLKTGDDGIEAAAEFSFEGQTVTLSYHIEQAKKSGLIKGDSGWTKTPGNMLRARVMSNALGMLAPEIFAGVDDETGTEPRSMSLETAVPITTAPKTTPPPVIDVKPTPAAATVNDEPALAAAGLAPATKVYDLKPAPAPAPVKPPAPVAPSNAPVAPLPDALVIELENAIGEDAIRAVEWMRRQTPPWIAPGAGLESLTETRARRILKNLPNFKQAINTPV